MSYADTVCVIEEVLDLPTCEELIRISEAGANFRPSVIRDADTPHDDSETIDRARRSSDSTVIGFGTLSCVDVIYEKITKLIGCDISQLEPMQVVRYGPGDRFQPHHDADGKLRRTKTVLVYLNDQFDGGYTYFPMIETAIQPLAGAALIFDNIDATGKVIPESLHESTTIEKGIKYVCNIWVHEIYSDSDDIAS